MSSDARGQPIAERARAWWRALQPANDEGGGKGDRAALARLRRAAGPGAAMAEEATLMLFRRLGLTTADGHRLPRVALIAMTLAHVREDDEAPVMRRVGRPSFDDADAAALKPLRLKRILAARDDDELAREMRRLVALAHGRLNVGELAASLFFWGDNVRTRWAFDYYAAGRAAPPLDLAGSAA